MRTLTAIVLGIATGIILTHIWLGHLEHHYWETR